MPLDFRKISAFRKIPTPFIINQRVSLQLNIRPAKCILSSSKLSKRRMKACQKFGKLMYLFGSEYVYLLALLQLCYVKITDIALRFQSQSSIHSLRCSILSEQYRTAFIKREITKHYAASYYASRDSNENFFIQYIPLPAFFGQTNSDEIFSKHRHSLLIALFVIFDLGIYNSLQKSWDFFYSAMDFHPPLSLTQSWIFGEVHSIMGNFRARTNFKCPTIEPTLL